jgi:hypothetical protein
MIRHPHNPNLILHYDPSFRDLLVMVQKGPLILNYLDRLYQTLQRSLNDHPRTFAVRFDLRYPLSMPANIDLSNRAISTFFEVLKDVIQSDREGASQRNGFAHSTRVRYAWAREYGQDGKPHYHCLLLLNRDAYHTVGRFDSAQQNMFKRISTAWLTALNLSEASENASGLTHIPTNAVWYLDKGNLRELEDLFLRSSYLCKAATKCFGDGQHAFECSRI